MKAIDTLFSRRALLSALLAILVAGAAPVLAQNPNIPDDEPDRAAMAPDDEAAFCADFGPGFGPGAGRGLERLVRHLDLTVEQRAAIAKIHETGRARAVPLRKEIMRLRHELRGEMMKDEPSGKTVTGLAAQMGEVRTRLQTGRLQDRLAVRELLTPDQRDRMLLLGERGEGRGPRQGGPRGGARHGGPHRWSQGQGSDQD